MATGMVVASACDVEVTTIGAITASPVTEGDTGADTAADIDSDPPLLGTWSVVSTPSTFVHLRATWLANVDEPWVLGIDPTITGGGDVGPTDALSTTDSGATKFTGVLLRRTTSGWSSFELPTVVDALWGSSSAKVWVVGTNALYLTNGTSYTEYPTPKTWTELKAVWGTDATHVWAAGTSMLHWDGTKWTQQPLVGGDDRVTALWGQTRDDVWAVSEAGVIRHWDGAIWTAKPSVTYSLRGVWGSAANDVFAVGDQGTILHWDGASWSSIDAGTTANLGSVWGQSKSDVWIVGAAGTILHGDSAKFTRYVSPVSADLSTVRVSSTGFAWAVGDGVVLRYQR